MDRRMRRLAYRVGRMIKEGGAESLEMLEFTTDHPITMKLLLERLKKDNDEAIRQISEKLLSDEPTVKPLLGPGDLE